LGSGTHDVSINVNLSTDMMLI